MGRNEEGIDECKGVGPVVGFFRFLVRLKGGKDCALNFCGRDTSYRSGFGFPSSQKCRADVEAIAHAVLAGKAWTHAVAAIIIEFTHQERLARGTTGFPAGGLRLEKLLDLVVGLSVEDALMLPLEPLVP